MLAIPVVLALVVWGFYVGLDPDDDVAVPVGDPAATLTVPSTGAQPGPTGSVDDRPFGPMSIVRSGNGFTLTGELSDLNTKTSLVQALGQAMPGARIIDQLTVNPKVESPDFSALGALFGTALDITGFTLTLAGGKLTLTGDAPAVDVRAAAAAAAGVAWPNVDLVNDIKAPAPKATPSPPGR